MSGIPPLSDATIGHAHRETVDERARRLLLPARRRQRGHGEAVERGVEAPELVLRQQAEVVDALVSRRERLELSSLGSVAREHELRVFRQGVGPARASPSARRAARRSRRRTSLRDRTAGASARPCPPARGRRRRASTPGPTQACRRRGCPRATVCATVSRWSSRGQSSRRAVRSASRRGRGKMFSQTAVDDARPLREAVQREHLEQERVDRLLLHPDRVRRDLSELARDPGEPRPPRAGRHVPHLDRQPRGVLYRGAVRLMDGRQVGRRRCGEHDGLRLVAPDDLLESASQCTG